jgi:hypothetical protein
MAASDAKSKPAFAYTATASGTLKIVKIIKPFKNLKAV